MTTRVARRTIRTETQRTAVVALLGAIVALAVLVAAGGCTPVPTPTPQVGSPQTTILPAETATQMPGATEEPDGPDAAATP
jgi:hypothetical protein